jgi:hypothetical protein
MFSKRFLSGFLFFVVFFVPLYLSVQAFGQEPYTFVLKWGGTGSGPGEFNFPSPHLGRPGGIAIDSMDNVYVIDRGNGRIQKFDKDGTYILQWGTYGFGNGQFMFAMGIGIDKNDNVYVSDGHWEVNYPTPSRVQKFDSQGGFIMKYENYEPGQPDSLWGPGGIDFDKDGFIYIVDWNGVKKFDPDFTFIEAYGSFGYDDTDPYQFFYPGYIGINSKGEIFVSFAGGGGEEYIVPGQIRKFGSDFQYLTRWYLQWVTGIAIDSEDNVLACSVWPPDEGVYKYDPNGNLIQRIAPYGDRDGEIYHPFGIAIDSEGNVYVADGLNRVQKFAPPRVAYTFEGFFSPIDNIPTVNKANAGQAIPVKWRITDKNGLPISDPASFIGITSYIVSCATFEGDPTNEVEEFAAGDSGLQYLGDGWWQFNWKTSKSYKGQCRIMKLTLDDKIEHTASFSFK